MRIAIGALLALSLAIPAGAQTAAPPKAPPAQQKQDPVAASYASMPEPARKAIQFDLIWTGDYAGAVDGDFGPRAIAAVKAFQKRNKSRDTGVLNPKERSVLGAEARKKREAVGWRFVEDRTTGTRIGLPTKIVSGPVDSPGGARWASAKGDAEVTTFRVAAPGTTLDAVYQAQRKIEGRQPTYNVIRPDFFVLSGTQGTKKLYVRGQIKDGDVRGFAIQYEPALAPTLDSVAIAMAGAFEAFPAGVPVAGPMRRKVEYGTAVFVSGEGHAITASDLIDGCQSFMLTGYGPADLVKDDKDAGVALLRVFGVAGLKPIALAQRAEAGAVTLVGIADPTAQAGAANVSSLRAAVQAGARPAVEPAPGLGFGGAAAVDASGRLAGIVDLRLQVVAGVPAPRAQATLVPAPAIAAFLAAAGVKPSGEAQPGDGARASAARVICVRK